MKKFLNTGLAIILASALTACDNNDGPASESFGDSVATLIIPDDATKPASAQMVQYTFVYNYGNRAMDFAISGMLYDGVDYKFTAENIPATNTDYFNGKIQTFNASSMSNAAGGAQAKDVKATVFTMLNFRPADIAPMLKVKRQYLISYKVGDMFTAKTFDSDAAYFGTTATSYIHNNEHKEFTTDKPVYNVVLDLKAGSATVAIYNPVFAAEMPPSMASTVMQIEGLKIEYLHDRYRIYGENLVPKVREGSLMVPNPNFTFNNFMLTTSSADLRRADISFKVADRYDAVATVTSALDRNMPGNN